MKVKLEPKERERIIRRRAWLCVMPTKKEGRLNAFMREFASYVVIWGLIAPVMGLIALVLCFLPNGEGDLAYVIGCSAIIVSGLLCLPVSIKALKKVKKERTRLEKELPSEANLVKSEILWLVNFRAYRKGLTFEGKFGKIKSYGMQVLMYYGIFATVVSILAIILSYDQSNKDSVFISVCGWLLATGVLCLPLTARGMRRIQKAKRAILNRMAEEEKKHEVPTVSDT